jgi:outer membrane biosynthesis protein TonB
MGQRVKERLRAVQDRFPGVTELVGALWGRMPEGPLVGILCSVALHVVLVALLLYVGGPGKTYSVKRGEPLFVELPEIRDQAPRGNPAAPTPGPPAAPAPPPTRPPVARAEPQPPAAKASPPAPRPAETKPKAPEPPRVASAPPRPPEPPRERPVPATSAVPKPPEPPSDAKEALPAPPVQEARPAPAPPAPSAPPPSPARGTEPPRAGSGSQVASVPPVAREPVFDLRSLGRGGGAGGSAEGRAGIEGDPVPLDSADPKYSDYLLRVKRQIEAKMVYPCIKDSGTQTCEYKSVELMLEFGIRKDGNLGFVALRNSSGYQIMDEASWNAVKLASPFPRVPDAVSKTGFPILARFRYHVVTTLY